MGHVPNVVVWEVPEGGIKTIASGEYRPVLLETDRTSMRSAHGTTSTRGTKHHCAWPGPHYHRHGAAAARVPWGAGGGGGGDPTGAFP